MESIVKCPECGAPCRPTTHLNLEPGYKYALDWLVERLNNFVSKIDDLGGGGFYVPHEAATDYAALVHSLRILLSDKSATS